jgi:hypothetical protein
MQRAHQTRPVIVAAGFARDKIDCVRHSRRFAW